MTVICAAIECEHNVNSKCMLTRINLSSHSIMTVWEGRQEFLRCRNYEKSEEMKRIEAVLGAIVAKREVEHD